MTGIEYLKSDDCPNIKAGMNLSEMQLFVIAGILEAYHKKESESEINNKRKYFCSICHIPSVKFPGQVCDKCIEKTQIEPYK